MEKSPIPPSSQHMWLKDIREGDVVQGEYAVREKRLSNTRKGDLFLTLILADRTGEVEAKVWEQAEMLSSRFREGDILDVEGTATSYRGRMQLTLSGLKPAERDVDQSVFLESSEASPAVMMSELRKILQEVRNDHMKSLIDRFLGDPRFVCLLERAPAAKNFHHCYLGGLLEHTLSVCRLTQRVADHYPQLDKDLLLTGAFLHDIGKIRELSCRLQIEYTDEGRLLGHLVQGTIMLEEKLAHMKSFPPDLSIRLKHLILSHHGQYEFGSPKRPKFLEAFVLHLADDLDAKVNGLGRFFERDGHEGGWTEYNRLFERYFLKGDIVQTEDEPCRNETEKEKQGNLF